MNLFGEQEKEEVWQDAPLPVPLLEPGQVSFVVYRPGELPLILKFFDKLRDRYHSSVSSIRNLKVDHIFEMAESNSSWYTFGEVNLMRRDHVHPFSYLAESGKIAMMITAPTPPSYELVSEYNNIRIWAMWDQDTLISIVKKGKLVIFHKELLRIQDI